MKFLYAVMQKEGFPHQSYKLQVVPYEIRTSKRCYWAYCLALVDDRQKYQCSQTWRSNSHRKAIKYLESNGWVPRSVVMKVIRQNGGIIKVFNQDTEQYTDL